MTQQELSKTKQDPAVLMPGVLYVSNWLSPTSNANTDCFTDEKLRTSRDRATDQVRVFERDVARAESNFRRAQERYNDSMTDRTLTMQAVFHRVNYIPRC